MYNRPVCCVLVKRSLVTVVLTSNKIWCLFSVEGSVRGGYQRRGSIRPATIPRQWVPPALWSATIKKGFVGCLRDLVINQVTVDVADYASKQDSGK